MSIIELNERNVYKNEIRILPEGLTLYLNYKPNS